MPALPITTLNVNLEDENRLRLLALELAKGIEEPAEILKKLEWSEEDYEEIASSRVFKAMLNQYIQEWRGAGNTQKRVKLKSATNIEAALPDFYAAMINPNEPLMARVKTLEILGKFSGLGVGENVPVAGGATGQYFKLEIHMDRGSPPIIIDGGTAGDVEPTLESKQEFVQSHLLDSQPWEDLS
jgi:hypothetical protein